MRILDKESIQEYEAIVISENGNMTELKGRIKSFRENQVWVTRKIRIESESRFESINKYNLFIVNYYTFTLLCLSVMALTDINSEYLTIMTVCMSIALFGTSIYISIYGYKEKALAFKMCYLELQHLEAKLECLELENEKSYREILLDYQNLKEEYKKILSMSDNHSESDRYKYLKNRGMLESEGLF